MSEAQFPSIQADQSPNWLQRNISVPIATGVALAVGIAGALGGYIARGPDVTAAVNDGNDRAAAATRNAHTEACQVYVDALERDALGAAATLFYAAHDSSKGMRIQNSDDKNTITLNRTSEKRESDPNNPKAIFVTGYDIAATYTDKDPKLQKPTITVSSSLDAGTVNPDGTTSFGGSGTTAITLVSVESLASKRLSSDIKNATNPFTLAKALADALDISTADPAFTPEKTGDYEMSGTTETPADLESCVAYSDVRKSLAGMATYNDGGFVVGIADEAAKAAPTEA